MSRLAPADAARVAAQFSEHGCVLLQGVFSAPSIGVLREAFAARYGAMTAEEMQAKCGQPGHNKFLEVGAARFDVAPTLDAPFSDPRLFANDGILSVLDLLLGEGYKVSSFTVVVSYPGADMQHVHRDHGHLFEGEKTALALPPHGVSAAIPLVDIDLEIGTTAIWPGSHRWETGAPCDEEAMIEPVLRAGDCLLIDYRTMHAGMPNQSTRIRPVLYIVYTRPWFFDENNFIQRNPLDMPEEQYAKLTPEVQQLMSRAARLRLLGR